MENKVSLSPIRQAKCKTFCLTPFARQAGEGNKEKIKM